MMCVKKFIQETCLCATDGSYDEDGIRPVYTKIKKKKIFLQKRIDKQSLVLYNQSRA